MLFLLELPLLVQIREIPRKFRILKGRLVVEFVFVRRGPVIYLDVLIVCFFVLNTKQFKKKKNEWELIDYVE